MTEPARDDALLPPELVMDEPPLTEEQLGQLAEGNDAEPVQLGSWEEVEWAFRRLARSRGVIDRAAARYAEMVGRIDAWYEDVTAADKKTVAYLTGLIERFALAQRTRDPRFGATLKFPSGTVRTTFRKDPRIDVEDERAVIAWALKNLAPEQAAEVLAQHLSVRVSDLRNYVRIATAEDGTNRVVTEDGEEVPGVFVNPPEVKVTKIELTTDTQEEWQ